MEREGDRGVEERERKAVERRERKRVAVDRREGHARPTGGGSGREKEREEEEEYEPSSGKELKE